MAKWFKDDLDRRLLALLQMNARESTTNLAKKLNVARSTVHERIARLQRDGVIRGYSVVLGRDPGEEHTQALVLLHVDQRKSPSVIVRLKSFPEVKLCLAISGQYDLFLTVEAPRLEDLDVILDELVAIPGIERSRSMVVLARKFDRRSAEIPDLVAQQSTSTTGETS